MKICLKSLSAGCIIGALGVTTVIAVPAIKSASFNSHKVVFDGKQLNLSNAPMISITKNDDNNIANYMPLRSVVEQMGYDVQWDDAKSTVFINSVANSQNVSAQLPNPVTNYNSLDQLQKAMGFDLKTPKEYDNPNYTASYSDINKSVAQVEYSQNGNRVAIYRVSRPTVDDISGVFENFGSIEGIKKDAYSANLFGNNGSFQIINWDTKDFTRSLYVPNGLSKDEIIKIADNIEGLITTSSIGMQNPITQFSTSQELANNIGFSLSELKYFEDKGYKASNVSRNGETASVTFKADGSNEITFRKTKVATDNLSGVYKTFNDVVEMSDNPLAKLSGNSGLYNVANWTSDGFTLSLYSIDAIARTQMEEIVKGVDANMIKSKPNNLPNPIKNFNTLADLESAISFTIAQPKSFVQSDYTASYSTIDGKVAQIRYLKDGNEFASYRVSKERTGDISGVYTELNTTQTIKTSNFDANIRGNSSGFSVATWEKDGYTHSLYLNTPVSLETMQGYLNSF